MKRMELGISFHMRWILNLPLITRLFIEFAHYYASIYWIDLFSKSNDITSNYSQLIANKCFSANYIQASNQVNAGHSDSMIEDGIATAAWECLATLRSPADVQVLESLSQDKIEVTG